MFDSFIDLENPFLSAPLLTHRLPLSQLATADFLAMSLLLTAAWVVRRREY
jgi:hypothetical protein